jgi:nitroreductase
MPELDLIPYGIAVDEFPITGTPSEKLAAAITSAVRAPSSHNSQPWVFRIKAETLELRADRSRALPIIDPDHRELVISCGAALFHVGLALRHFGTMPRIDRVPDAKDPNLLARVTIGQAREQTAEDQALFDAIPQRHTHRHRFVDRCLPEGLGSALELAARMEGAWVHVFRTAQARHAVAELVAEADRLQMSDKRFRREIAGWLRPNRGKRKDGIPGYALGAGAVQAAVEPMVVRLFDAGRKQADQDRRLVAGAPLLVLLGTGHDTAYDWLVAGEAVAHLLLRAQVSGIAASFLNQPIEIPSLRTRLLTVAGRAGYPQLLLRLGYGSAQRATPRRPAAEVTEVN